MTTFPMLVTSDWARRARDGLLIAAALGCNKIVVHFDNNSLVQLQNGFH